MISNSPLASKTLLYAVTFYCIKSNNWSLNMFYYAFRCLMLSHLTLQVCPSSRAALWASTGLSMTRPVRPEKSMATREFSDTLRCFPETEMWRGGVGGLEVEWSQGWRGAHKGWRVRVLGRGGRQEVRGQTSQTQSLGRDKSCLHTGPLQPADVAAERKAWALGSN